MDHSIKLIIFLCPQGPSFLVFRPHSFTRGCRVLRRRFTRGGLQNLPLAGCKGRFALGRFGQWKHRRLARQTGIIGLLTNYPASRTSPARQPECIRHNIAANNRGSRPLVFQLCGISRHALLPMRAYLRVLEVRPPLFGHQHSTQ